MASTQWTRTETKMFEEALVRFPDLFPGRWESIAQELQKSTAEVREHYEALLHDVVEIDSGRVDVPEYVDDWLPHAATAGGRKLLSRLKHGGDTEKKRGTPWTESEHKLFLLGLNKYGRGDWRSISRNFVITRTPTQVASHAQKYFLRQDSGKKERKRSSIHDITTVDNMVAIRGPDWGWPELETPDQPLLPLPQSRLLQPQSQPQLPQQQQQFMQGQAHPQPFPSDFQGQGHPQPFPSDFQGQGHHLQPLPRGFQGQGHHPQPPPRDFQGQGPNFWLR